MESNTYLTQKWQHQNYFTILSSFHEKASPPIDARTAAEWGLVNKVVPAEQLDEETRSLLERATRGSVLWKGIGKQAFYAQIDLDHNPLRFLSM